VGWGTACANSYSVFDLQEKKDQKYDYVRTARFTSFGTFIMCPLLHVYTAKLLPSLFNMSVGGKTTLFKKLAFDQLIGASFFNALFFFTMGLMETKSITASVNNTKDKFVTCMLCNWLYWPFVNYFNFGKVPVELQVLVMNAASLLWNTALSYFQNKSKS
jgi:hypothetical protein